jgi:hypothetical protein
MHTAIGVEDQCHVIKEVQTLLLLLFPLLPLLTVVQGSQEGVQQEPGPPTLPPFLLCLTASPVPGG